MADLLFDLFGFYQTSKAVAHYKYLGKAAESKQNKQEVSHAVILPLKLVFSGPPVTSQNIPS